MLKAENSFADALESVQVERFILAAFGVKVEYGIVDSCDVVGLFGQRHLLRLERACLF